MPAGLGLPLAPAPVFGAGVSAVPVLRAAERGRAHGRPREARIAGTAVIRTTATG